MAPSSLLPAAWRRVAGKRGAGRHVGGRVSLDAVTDGLTRKDGDAKSGFKAAFCPVGRPPFWGDPFRLLRVAGLVLGAIGERGGVVGDCVGHGTWSSLRTVTFDQAKLQ